MSRTPDEKRRTELLERMVDYVYAPGVSQLSLRPLAQAVGCSPRLLLYFFSPKEDLVTEVLAAAGRRQGLIVERLQLQNLATPAQACREIWRAVGEPASEPLFRLLFEGYGLALQDRERYASFLNRVVADWLDFVARPLLARGMDDPQARARATLILAGFRGFLLDLCATRDRARVDAGVEMWLQLLDMPSSQREIAS